MSVMTASRTALPTGRPLTVEDLDLVAFEVRRGTYHEVAGVSGDEVYRAARPFPVEIVPSALVSGLWQR